MSYSRLCLIQSCTGRRQPCSSCGLTGSSLGVGGRHSAGGGGVQNVTLQSGAELRQRGGEHWRWPCTFHLQALIKPSQAGIDLSQNNPFRLSVPGHVGPLQLFMAECCASFRWDATTCPGKPVNCGSQESKGDTEGWRREEWKERSREEGEERRRAGTSHRGRQGGTWER